METVAPWAIGLLQSGAVAMAAVGALFLVALWMVLLAGRKAEATEGELEISVRFGNRFSIAYKRSGYERKG